MPYIVPSAKILIKTQSGKTYQITRFQYCKITLSRVLPCDLAELTLPLLSDLRLFAENDQIKITLGNDHLGTSSVFEGYITRISPNQKPVLYCEDYFKEFKEKRHSQSFFDTPDSIARQIIEHCGFEPVIPDTWQSRTHFYWYQQTAAEALAALASLGWDFYCIPTTRKIYFGIPYRLPKSLIPNPQSPTPNPPKYVFRFGLNIIDSDLEYHTANPIGKAIVYVTDAKFRGHSIKVEQGTAEPVKIFYQQMDFDPDDPSLVNGAKAQATKFAKQEINQSLIQGFKGTFTTFGNPFLTHSIKIKLDDSVKQERSGNYFIDQVIHEISPDLGYKTQITVGGKEQ